MLYPWGDAKKAWDALLSKYEPDNGQAMVDLKLEFNASTLSSVEEDPDVWIANLMKLKSRLNAMGVTLMDSHLLLHILCNLLSEYETIIEIDKRELKAKTLTIEDLQVMLNARYKRLQGPRDDGQEKGLSIKQSSSLECQHCRLWGYLTDNCVCLPKNKTKFDEYFKKKMEILKKGKNGGGKKDPRACWKCGKLNHRKVSCPKNENGNRAREEEEIALILRDLSEKQTMKVFEYLWVGDLGTSCHMGPTLKSCKDIVLVYEQIIIGDGCQLTIKARATFVWYMVEKVIRSKKKIRLSTMPMCLIWTNFCSALPVQRNRT